MALTWGQEIPTLALLWLLVEVISRVISTAQVRDRLTDLRTEEQLQSIMTEVAETLTKLELEPLRLPKIKQPPKRFSGSAAAYHSTTVSHTVLLYRILQSSRCMHPTVVFASAGIDWNAALQGS